MIVHCTTLPGWDTSGHHVEDMKRALGVLSQSREHVVTNDPGEADVILLFERNANKTPQDLRLMLQSPVLRRHSAKCFCVNFDDQPLGLLPGGYVSLPRSRFDWRRHRAITYMGQYNEVVARLAEHRDQYEQNLLFSFRGARSWPTRARMFADLQDRNSGGRVTETFRWFDHSEAEKTAFVEEMLHSKFVLCPRGGASSSIRMFETMELGRAPVVIADEYVEPDGPDWLSFAVFVSEERVPEIPRLLGELEPSAAQMGQLARQAWEKWFSPATRVPHLLRAIRDIGLRRPPEPDEQRNPPQWMSWRLWAQDGYTMPQRIRRKINSIVQHSYKRVRRPALTDEPTPK